MVENTSKIESKRWHNQRIHLVISAMMHFADELEKKGFEVDYLKSSTLKDGLEVHRKTYEVSEIIAMECAGVSKSILMVPALFFGLCVACLAFVIYVIPPASSLIGTTLKGGPKCDLFTIRILCNIFGICHRRHTPCHFSNCAGKL